MAAERMVELHDGWVFFLDKNDRTLLIVRQRTSQASMIYVRPTPKPLLKSASKKWRHLKTTEFGLSSNTSANSTTYSGKMPRGPFSSVKNLRYKWQMNSRRLYTIR